MASSVLSQSSINNFKKYRNLEGPLSPIEFFVLGGGGAGAGALGSGGSMTGGGSGYYQSGTLLASSYLVSIGAGGAGAPGNGSSGVASTIGAITANGGIRGILNGSAGNGGSGGSGGSASLAGGINGANGNGSTAGLGSGVTLLDWIPIAVNTFSTSSGFYGGGQTSPPGQQVSGRDALPNTGGGGGGAYTTNINQSPRGGNGGSGRIIFRYYVGHNIVIGAGLTGTTQIVDGKKITTITQGTGTVSWVA
jgi:hypothetical protein